MARRAYLFVWLLVAYSTTAYLSTAVLGQTSPATADTLALVPQDALALLTLKPSAIAREEGFRMMPLEVATAAGMQYLGIDPLKIQRVDAMMGLPLGGMGNLPAAILITHGEVIPVQLLQQFSPGGAVNEKGLELWPLAGTPDFVVHLRSPRQAIVGSRSYVTRLLKLKQPEGELRKFAAQMGEPVHASLVVVFEQLRELLVSLTEAPQVQQVPQLATDLKILAEKTRMLAIDLRLGDAPASSYIIQADSEADAQKISQSITSLVRLGGAMLIANMENEMQDQSGRTPAAMIAYAKRLHAFLQDKLTLKPAGNRLLLKLENEELIVGQVGVLAGLLLPAVQASRTAARRMQSSNNLKQMGLAIHNFASVGRQLPNDAARPLAEQKSKTGGKLSWRVKLLPFLEHQQLYDEFHLDEDWDSPHNLKLLEKMPAFYSHPNLVTAPGHTVYQMPSGPKMINEADKQLGFRDITDGTSNTVGIVTTTAAAAVPWTKPDELDPVANRELLFLEGNTYSFAYLDGAVLNVVAPRDDETFSQMFTINGGEIAPRP